MVQGRTLSDFDVCNFGSYVSPLQLQQTSAFRPFLLPDAHEITITTVTGNQALIARALDGSMKVSV